MFIEEERKKAFVVFASTYEAAVNHLTFEQMGELFMKLGRYSLEGEEVNSETPMVDIILKMTIPNMNAAERRHQAAIENGKKGKRTGGGIGAPRKGETKEEYQKRLSAWRASLEGGGNNPQEPLNNDIDRDTDSDKKKEIDTKTEKDIEIKKEIKKKTNGFVENNSIISNSILSLESSNLQGGKTKQGEEPRQGAKLQPQVLSDDSNLEREEAKHGAEPRQEERPRKGSDNGSKGSDFIRSITLEDSNDYDGVPPCPPDDRYMNYVGDLQDIFRYDAEPDYSEMTDADMMDAVKETIDDAIETETWQGKTQRFWDLMHRAKRIYMHLNGCSEEDAKRGIGRLYGQKMKEQRSE